MSSASRIDQKKTSKQGLDNPCDAHSLERLFRQTFYQDYLTVLQGGMDEPLYQPATQVGEPHRLYYREDFVSSALHEIAHWCIAGEMRRRRVDFGYWYIPDGRNQQQQKTFESVEVKPQALEWLFSEAAGVKFHFSVDNLSGSGQASSWFIGAVTQQAACWCVAGLPERAAMFIDALIGQYGTEGCLDPARYSHHQLSAAEPIS